MKKLTFLILLAATPAAFAFDAGDDASVPNYIGVATGGTSTNPAQYTIGVVANYQADYTVGGTADQGSGTVNAGYLSSYNSITVQNGADVTTYHTGANYLASNNNLSITGAGTTWTSTAEFAFGYVGSNGQLTIEDGARLSDMLGDLGLGDSGSGPSAGSNNQATVTGPGSLWSTSTDVNVGILGSHNTLTVSDGGQVTTGSLTIGSGQGTSLSTFSQSNQVLVTGPGSILTTSSLYVGTNSSGYRSGSGNTLTIADQGLVELSSTFLVFGTNTTAGKNVLQLNNGYFALGGNQLSSITSFVSSGNVLYWSGSGYVTATPADLLNGNLTAAYYDTNAAATAATGGLYNFLGGYTILTAIPEPTTYGLGVALLLGVGIVLRRRQLTRDTTR